MLPYTTYLLTNNLAAMLMETETHAQNTTNLAISLVVYNVIHLLIGRSKLAPISSIMYPVGEGTRPCPFPVTGNGHGRVT